MTESVVVMDQTIPAVATIPEAVEVKIGDKSYKVSKDVAEAVKGMQDAAAQGSAVTTEAINHLNQELAALKAAAVKHTPKDDDGSDPYQELFINPKAFLSKFSQAIKQEVLSSVVQTNAQQAFWQDFYNTHADLKEFDHIVKATMTRDFKVLQSLTVDKAIEKLGETVKADLLKLKGKGGGKGKPVTEAGTESTREQSNPTGEGESSPTPDKPTTTVSILKQRREARRKALVGATA